MSNYQKCSKCKEYIDLENEKFVKGNYTIIGFRYWHLECHKNLKWWQK